MALNRGFDREREAKLSARAAPKSYLLSCFFYFGEMSEWSKVHAWKACVLERVPGVRIPLSPYSNEYCIKQYCGMSEYYGVKLGIRTGRWNPPLSVRTVNAVLND